jgi:hypothetical protein
MINFIGGLLSGFIIGIIIHKIHVRIRQQEKEWERLFSWEDERQMREKTEAAYQKVLMDLQESKVTNEKPINE